jgi:hypothetical protein
MSILFDHHIIPQRFAGHNAFRDLETMGPTAFAGREIEGQACVFLCCGLGIVSRQ